MKRRVLFKKSASLVLALTLTTQGLPAYALVNEVVDAPVAETESCVDTVAEDVEATTEGTQEEIEIDVVLAETAVEENSETAEKDNAETADETEDVEEAEQEEVVDQYQAEEPGNDAAAEPIQPVYDQAKVQDVTYGDVATNPEYKQFSFQFGDDKGHQYECFITGLKGIRGGMEDIQSVAQRIANYFLTYVPLESFKLVLDEFDCIDAEKNDNGWDDRRPTLSGSPYGDTQLCWAAVDANMLTYTGWTGPYKNEDQVFTAYTDSFFNMSGFEDAGLAWFLNGVFPNQQVTEEGTPWFQDHLEDIYNGSTQLRKPETGGYANDYYYGNVSQHVKAGDDDFNAALVIDNLKAGNAIGTSVNFMDEDQMPMSAHALTVFGYIRDLADQSMDGLKTMFVANSDDDMGNTESIIHEDPKVTEEKREAKPNKLIMEFLYPCDLQGKETWCMDNSPWNDRVISDFAILKSKVSVPDTSKEELGTKDPVHSQDMVITGFCVYEEGVTTFEEGEEFRLSIYAKNMSYASFKAEDDPVINFKCSVYKDGKLYDVMNMQNNLIHPKYREDLPALVNMAYMPLISFSEAGEYTLKIAIDSIVDKNGNVMQEAYTSNNTYDKELTYTIIPKQKPDPTPDPAPQPETEHADVKESQEDGCNCFCTKLGKTCSCTECLDVTLEKDWKEKLLKVADLSYIIQEKCQPMQIELPEKVSEPQTIYVDEELLCKNLYQVTKNEQGRYELEIDGEVIRYLGPGDHQVIITTEEGYILYQLQVK